MSLVVFLKGVNVGGHRRFRPSLLARELAHLGVINVGATGTFVVRERVGRAKLRKEIARRLPFETEVMVCEGADVLRLAAADPFAGQPSGRDLVRFVSVLANRPRISPTLPLALPAEGEWSLRVLELRERFVLGLYRREMRAIGFLGQLEKVFGVPLTTRSWSTIETVARLLSS